MVSKPGYETVGSKDLTCEDWMVNTRTYADLSAAVQTPCRHCFPRFAQRFARSSVPVLDRRMQFFPRAEQERLKREYHSIRQMNTETSTEFMQRFLRLVGFLGAAADKRQKSGDRHQLTSQQSSHRNHGYNNDRHGLDKRGGSDNHHSSNNNYSGSNNRNSGYGRDQRNRGQQSNRSTNSGSQQSRSPSEGYSYPVCTTCGRGEYSGEYS
nr:hypothetical protein [Tanacetum cinerariifolium]